LINKRLGKLCINNLMYNQIVKICLIGDADVGKTSLIQRFTTDTYTSVKPNTVGVDFYTKKIKVDDDSFNLHIWDTAGQERFRSMANSYFKNIHGIIIVYDVTQIQSFENVEEWLHLIDQNSPTKVIKILVGNKCDLKQKRIVSVDQARQYAKENEILYFETSAADSSGVTKLFEEMCRSISKKTFNKDEFAEEKIIKVSTHESNKKIKYCCF